MESISRCKKHWICLCLLSTTCVWTSCNHTTFMYAVFLIITHISWIKFVQYKYHPAASIHIAASHFQIQMNTDFFYSLILFSPWWEVICCNAWSGCFETAISSCRDSPSLCGRGRLFSFLHQLKLLKPKDSAILLKLNETSHRHLAPLQCHVAFSAFLSLKSLSHVQPLTGHLEMCKKNSPEKN